MATFVLVHGAGSDAWYWHLVAPRLEAAGHAVVTMDLPCDDDAAGLEEYAAAIERAIGDRTDLVLVAQSLGGFSAPLVAARRNVDLIVLVAAMVPAPDESGGDWWANTGAEQARQEAAAAAGAAPGEVDDPEYLFLHDLPADVAAASAAHVREQSGTPFAAPWPLAAWPEVQTRFLLCRDDRFFPAAFQRRVVRARLGIVPDEMDGGHLPALARPDELAGRLLAYRADWERSRG